MKRDATMARLMANHVIEMIRLKRVGENELLKAAKPEDKKDHPVKEAIQAFFNANPKAFGCEREMAMKLMTALTGFDYGTAAALKSEHHDQYSVVASLIDCNGSINCKAGLVLLVGSKSGRVFTPTSAQTESSQVAFYRRDARRATDAEYDASMAELATEAGKDKLVIWMAHNGIADQFFGLKSKD